MEIIESKIKEWQVLYDTLKTIKEKEKELRIAITSEILDGSLKPVTVNIGDFVVKATPSINRSVDEATYVAIFDELSDLERSAIRSKLEVNKRVMDTLPGDSILFEAITSKPGLSKLEVTNNM